MRSTPGAALRPTGSVRALTDGTGAVVNSDQYDAYGNRTSSSETVANPFGYAGGYRDSESGLYYLQARYYDPSTQQFLTVDTMPTELPYAYVDGSPLNYVDPTGHGPEILLVAVACPECLAIGAAGALAFWLIWNLQYNQQLQACLTQLGNQLTSNTFWSQTADQRALKDLVDEATNGGRKALSKDDAETILDWAGEVKYPGARAKPGDVSDPSNWHGPPDHPPHIHIPGAGRGGHVPVQPGVRPR